MTDEENKAAGGFVRDLGDAARRNPVSAALIGMGALWLFSGGARRVGFDGVTAASDAAAKGRAALRTGMETVSNTASNLAERAGAATDDAMNAVKGSVLQRGGAVHDRTANSGSDFSAGDLVRTVPDSVSEAYDNLRSNLSSMFHDQPLLLGAVGVAIGAGIAASFPLTEVETEYLGETSDRLKDKVQEVASVQTERVKATAQGAIKAGTDEARRQGLDLEGVKAAASDIGERVKTVVGAAKATATQRVDPA